MPRVVACVLAAVGLCGAASLSAAEGPSFVREVAPLLTVRCLGCHGDKKGEGDYRLHTYKFLLEPGASGDAAVVPGKPAESELFRRLIEADDDLRMPQLDSAFSPAEIAVVEKWIAAGAKFDGADPAGSLKSQLPHRQHAAPPEKYPHATPVLTLAFSPDGGRLFAGGLRELLTWDANTGKLLQRIPGLPPRISALAFSPDGKSLLIGGGAPGDYGELFLLDAAGTSPPRPIAVAEDLILGVAWKPDGSGFAAACADRTVTAYDAAGKRLWESRLHADWATAVSFSADGRFLASAGRDCTIKVLDAATGKLFTTCNAHQMEFGGDQGRFEVNDVRFAPTGPRAYSVGAGKALRVWEPEQVKAESGDARDMEERFRKDSHLLLWPHGSQRPAFRLALTADRLFVGTGDGAVLEYDTASGKLLTTRPVPGGWVFATAVHAGAGKLAAGTFDGTIRVWNLAGGDATLTFIAAPGR